MCTLTNSALVAKLDRADDFYIANDSIFINDFDISNKMCVLMNSMSGAEP